MRPKLERLEFEEGNDYGCAYYVGAANLVMCYGRSVLQARSAARREMREILAEMQASLVEKKTRSQRKVSR